MTNGNQHVTSVTIEETKGILYKGEAVVNNNKVYFYYNFKEDKFQASSLSNEDYRKFGFAGNIKNWKYLVCGSIAHSIKNNINVTFNN